MAMDRVVLGALLHLTFTLGLAAGGYGVWYVDHRPAIDWTVPAPVRWVLPASWKHVRLEGLMAQRDTARIDAAQAHAQLAALQQQSAAKLAQAQAVASAARVEARRAEARGKRVLAVPKQDDSCKFARAVDQAFTEALK